ncbi:Gabbr2 [Symbiodinium natans]|uniref:Gabbr2 protein n=1 Tax=Symbiodinium natans TaxID=878477 RepID=A0A812KMQ5_9DINO|nr:Gabbr2 [Symbiodinium natans]
MIGRLPKAARCRRWLLLIALALPAEALLCPALCPMATTDGHPAPCRYHSNNCIVPTIPNTTRVAMHELNIVVMNPYSGAAGDVATVSEPLLQAAAQEIEDSSFLPGYRLKVHVVDAECSAPIGIRRTIASLSASPPKHAVLGAVCSGTSEGVNDALYHYNVLQVSPSSVSVSLSDRTRFPYFTRVVPSYRFNVLALFDVLKMLNFRRVGIVHGARSISVLARDLLLELVQQDLDSGAYPWTVLLQAQVQDLDSASDAMDLVRSRDSRINMIALYEDDGAVLLCQAYIRGMLSPDYVWMLSSGWWLQNFAQLGAGTANCPCTAEELLRTGFGAMGFDMGPMMNTNDMHGLSGRRLSDIYSDYLADCSAFANGTGLCSVEVAGYTYDGLWHIAAILHGFLVEQNRSYHELNTEFSRESLYQLFLQQDYMGSTGRVRIFNSVEPTTSPPSHGDREGQILIRQITSISAQPFSHLGIWSSTGITWLADVVWSSTNSSQAISCSSGTCDMSTAFIPADRSNRCPAGTTWKNELGCDACPLGRFAAAGMDQCEPCRLGSFSNESGLAECRVCPAGSVGKAQGAEQCSICNEGFFMNESGSSQCRKCYEGTFADESGLTQCRECPAGRTTNFQGALDAQACTCNGDLWEGQCFRCGDATRFERGKCVTCQDGLHCEEGEAPVILPGFYATPDLPYDVYKCIPADKCPGPTPGACAGGRIGVPCTRCPDGLSFEDGICSPCGNLSTAGWVAAMLFGMLALVIGYYLMNSAATAKVSMLFATTCVLSMTITMLQSVGIVGMISFDWPSELSWIFDAMNLFLLDIDSLGFDCVAGNPINRYGFSVAALPCALLWIMVAGLISRVLPFIPHHRRFELSKTLSTMGQVIQVTFTIVSKTALEPMMCYSHPNGKQGLMKHNGIFCFESPEHTSMLILGLLLLCGLIAFYALAVFGTVFAPRAAKQGRATFLQSIRFLIARFRVDYWWYGTFMLPRGLMLSLSIVLAADYPYVQMLLIVLILELYMMVQLIVWPWKLPALNLFDGIVSVCLVMMMVCMGAFTPALPAELKESLTSVSIAIMVMMQVVVLAMVGVTVSAMIYRNAIGGSKESPLLALGKVPDTQAGTSAVFQQRACTR